MLPPFAATTSVPNCSTPIFLRSFLMTCTRWPAVIWYQSSGLASGKNCCSSANLVFFEATSWPIKYLVGQLLTSHAQKIESLREFMPTAKSEDWELIQAGQRAQVMKKDPKKGGVLQFGTEVVTSAYHSIAGLLGASPGASTAVSIMLNLLRSCFPDSIGGWEPRLRELIPSYGSPLNPDAEATSRELAATAGTLALAH